MRKMIVAAIVATGLLGNVFGATQDHRQRELEFLQPRGC